MSSGWLDNPCQGIRWRTLSSGEIEVDGADLPDLDDAAERSHDLWLSLARQAGSTYAVPTSWVLAVIAAETGFLSTAAAQASAVSPKGAVGVMQIMPATATTVLGGDAARLTDPWYNISLGTKLLGRLRQQHHELPLVAAAYNAGGVYCSQSGPWQLRSDPGYVSNVVAAHNRVLELLGSKASTAARWLAYAMAGAGVVVGVGIAFGRIQVPRLER